MFEKLTERQAQAQALTNLLDRASRETDKMADFLGDIGADVDTRTTYRNMGSEFYALGSAALYRA